jgi:ATP-binding cassette subfamily B protein
LILAGLNGALPALFAALVGRLIGTLPEVVTAGGFDTAAGRELTVLLAGMGILLVAQDLASAAYELAKWAFYRRYEHYLLTRVINATIGTERLELFENPQLATIAERAVRLAGWEPGDLVDGWCCRWLRLAEGFAAAVLVATVWPVASAVLTVVWLIAGAVLQAGSRRTDANLWGSALQSTSYLTRIAEQPAWAKEVRVFRLTDWLADRFGRQWLGLLDELAQARKIGRGRTLAVLVGVIASQALLLAAMVRAASTGDLSIEQLTVLVQGMLAMAALADPMGVHLVMYGSNNLQPVLALEREAAATRPIPPTRRVSSPAGEPKHEIRFQGVGFSYPGSERAVFDDLDLTIEAGTSLGIVGLNGAGKTTLIKLLTGLETPDHGRITVDGRDLVDLDTDSWRRTVAAIFQDFVHYELSARDNIAFGAVDLLDGPADDLDELVRTAARRTGADGVLADLPQGLDTILSRRFAGGVEVSGGQWQRIALARAMAAVGNGARVLVLDEPTAQLDVRAEADVYDRFIELTCDLTTIVISHRFSTVRRADRIVVLDGGRITEDGTHDELLARGGRYARLFTTQAASYAPIVEGDRRAE